jgi:exodeoxyribonuclease VII large subunit
MTKRSGSDDGEMLLGFDMAPVLPGKKRQKSEVRDRGSDSSPSAPVSENPTPKSANPKLSEAVPDGRSPIPDPPSVFSVSGLTRHIADLLEEGVGSVWVEGEISNLRTQSSGHSYFTLKDAGSQLSCVLFARTAANLSVAIQDGQQVQLFGKIGVYEPRGQYQLIVSLVQEKGIGVLQARFEELKRRLAAEGLFAPESKKPVPRLPRRIGVVTSPTGAAIRDFLHVLHRRHPGLRVVIHPVRVQGRGAAAEIASAISDFNDPESPAGPLDVIVVTRGGGSLEDLWEFNEEAVARAIAASAIPVVSAVGHEIDFTIADFVADLRAPTPSAAAEILAADGGELLARCESLVTRIGREALTTGERLGSRLDLARTSLLFREPERRIRDHRQTLDRSESDLGSLVDARLEKIRSGLETAEALLMGTRPEVRISSARIGLEGLSARLISHLGRIRERDHARLARVEAALTALDPAATLKRGFSITRTTDGRVVTSVSSVKSGDLLRTQVSDGEIRSEVKDVERLES